MSDSFFSRWSRRKHDAAAGRVLPEALPEKLAEDAPLQTVQPQPQAPQQVQPATAQEEPLPSMDDVQPLTPHSDFQPFMRQGVTPEVRNAAMKKLFADPHFNVMDGLDIYIGDYTQPDPLPAGMLEQMVGAQLLNLVPPEKASTDGAQACELPVGGTAQKPQEQQAPALVAQSADSAAPMAATDTDHDHTDLQLQPDPAAADIQAGTGPR